LSIDLARCGDIENSRFHERRHGKLIAGGIIFILLTLAIFVYQFHRVRAGDAIPALNQLRWGYLALMLLFFPVETLALGLRMWVVGRVLQPGISYWTCFKADVANSGVALLTPFQSGGGPVQVYVLNQGGARLATALTMTVLTFTGSAVALLGFGLYSLCISGIGYTAPLFMGAIFTLVSFIGVMIFSAVWPGSVRTLIAATSRWIWRIRGERCPLQDWWPPGTSQQGLPVDRMGPLAIKAADLLYVFRADLRRYFRRGKTSFVIVCLLSLTFLFSRSLLAYFCVRFFGIQDSTIGEIFEIQMALTFFTYLTPTPGNAGIVEGASSWAMGDIVPMGFAPYYNLLWRFSTVYITAAAGVFLLVYQIILALRKNNAREQAR
jgi:glycosyltransferase 2 family protein